LILAALTILSAAQSDDLKSEVAALKAKTARLSAAFVDLEKSMRANPSPTPTPANDSVDSPNLNLPLGYNIPSILGAQETSLSRRLGTPYVVDYIQVRPSSNPLAIKEVLENVDARGRLKPSFDSRPWIKLGFYGHPKLQKTYLWLYSERGKAVAATVSYNADKSVSNPSPQYDQETIRKVFGMDASASCHQVPGWQGGYTVTGSGVGGSWTSRGNALHNDSLSLSFTFWLDDFPVRPASGATELSAPVPFTRLMPGREDLKYVFDVTLRGNVETVVVFYPGKRSTAKDYLSLAGLNPNDYEVKKDLEQSKHGDDVYLGRFKGTAYAKWSIKVRHERSTNLTKLEFRRLPRA